METSTPIEIAVVVERSSEQNVGVDVSISGGDFRETVHVSGDPVIVEVPGPGTYVFVVETFEDSDQEKALSPEMLADESDLFLEVERTASFVLVELVDLDATITDEAIEGGEYR
jgi:hypothetical protein